MGQCLNGILNKLQSHSNLDDTLSKVGLNNEELGLLTSSYQKHNSEEDVWWNKLSTFAENMKISEMIAILQSELSNSVTPLQNGNNYLSL